MRIRSLALPLLLCVTPVAGNAQALRIPDSLPPGVTREMVSRGRDLFKGRAMCGNCHGPEAMGLLGPNLTDAEWWHVEGSYLAILERINSGVPIEQSRRGVAMPRRGGSNITDHQVQAVAAYVWSLGHRGEALPVPLTNALVDEGRQVFQGAGRCVTCHGPEARGDVGPNLTDAEWIHQKGSYLAIVGTVLTGVPSSRSRRGLEMPARGGAKLTDAEVYDVAAYVWALGRRR